MNAENQSKSQQDQATNLETAQCDRPKAMSLSKFERGKFGHTDIAQKQSKSGS